MSDLWLGQVLGADSYGTECDVPRVPYVEGVTHTFECWHKDTFWLGVYDQQTGGKPLYKLWPQPSGAYHSDPLHELRG